MLLNENIIDIFLLFFFVLNKTQIKFIRVVQVSSGDLLTRLAIPGPKALCGFHSIHALYHLVKDYMLAIQPLGVGSVDEKLGSVCVGSSICRGQDARPCASG